MKEGSRGRRFWMKTYIFVGQSELHSWKGNMEKSKYKNETLGAGEMALSFRALAARGPEFSSQKSYGASQPSIIRSDTLSCSKGRYTGRILYTLYIYEGNSIWGTGSSGFLLLTPTLALLFPEKLKTILVIKKQTGVGEVTHRSNSLLWNVRTRAWFPTSHMNIRLG